MGRWWGRVGLLAAPLVAVALYAAPARSAGPERIELGYDISVAGFHVIDFDLAIAVDERAYDVTTTFRTHGVFDWFVQWHSVSQSVGRVKNGRVSDPSATRRAGRSAATGARSDFNIATARSAASSWCRRSRRTTIARRSPRRRWARRRTRRR